MNSTVRELRPVQNAPDADMLAAVEDVLERVKRGDVVALAIAAHIRGGDIRTSLAIAEGGDGAHLVAALEQVKMHLLFPNL